MIMITRPIGRQAGDRRPVLGRQSELLVGSYQVLCAFYEASTPLDTPRQAFPARSIPFGPNLSIAETSASTIIGPSSNKAERLGHRPLDRLEA